MKRIIFFSLLAAAVFLTPTLLDSDALAGGSKGLKVFLTINTNLVSQPVEIDTYQFDQFVSTHHGYMDNGMTQIEIDYEKGEIVNGEFEVCVYPSQVDMDRCANGYDSKAKEPVYVSIDLFGSNSPQPVDQPRGQENSQSQSSANNNENENNNALSQSQETTIYICNDGKCQVK